MKIKKMFQGEIPENKIMSAYSDSQTDTYSCDYFNKMAKKSSCCCYLAGGAITGAEIRNYGTVFNSGDGFEVGTNKITIKKGVSRIRISANLNIQFSVSGATYIRIFILKNGTEFMSNYAYTSGMTQWYYDTCSIPPIELDVNEGDVIEMKVTTQANGTIHNDQYGRSWIQVEAVSGLNDNSPITNYIDSQIVETNEYLNGKRVYAYRFQFSQALTKSTEYTFDLPFADEIDFAWVDLSNSFMDNHLGTTNYNVWCLGTTSGYGFRLGIATKNKISIVSDDTWGANWTYTIMVKFTKKNN